MSETEREILFHWQVYDTEWNCEVLWGGGGTN